MSQTNTVTISLQTYEELKSKEANFNKSVVFSRHIDCIGYREEITYYSTDDMVIKLKEEMQEKIEVLKGHNNYLINRVEELKKENESFKESKKEKKRAYFDSIKKLLNRK